MKNNKINFSAISKSTLDRINLREKQGDKFVRYGEGNKFPQELIDLYNNSSIHGTAINSIVKGIIGEGLMTTNDKDWMLDKANFLESWNDILKKVAFDYKLFGGFAIEVIYDKTRTRPVAIYHIDFSYVRAKEKDHRGKIPGYYLYNDWSRTSSLLNSREDLPYLPCFDALNEAKDASQILVYSPYNPGQKYYPLPDYVGALRVIAMDQEVDNFHINNLKNGLTPSLAITTFTNADDEERGEILRMLEDQYKGTDNAGSLMYMDVDSKENAPIITPIPQNGADGYYTSVNDMVIQKILTAHRITSPMILGIKTEGQLGGRSEMLDAWNLLLNNVIAPYQQDILTIFEKLLGLKYPNEEVELAISQTKLFDDGEEEIDVTTSTEAEVGVDAEIEDDLNEE